MIVGDRRLLIGVFVLWFFYSGNGFTQETNFYVCPMHSHIKQDHASSCPICGMKLIKRKIDNEKDSFKLLKEVKRAINVTSENVRRMHLRKEINAGVKLESVQEPYTDVVIDLLKPNLSWLAKGSLVELTASDYVRGDRTWHGEVVSIPEKPDRYTLSYPTKIKLNTPYNILKPGMFATLIFYGEERSALVIPFNSVMRSSKGKSYVVQSLGENKYQLVEVEVGTRQDHLVEIKSGLSENDKVVSSGQFLLYSELRLQQGRKEEDQ